MEWVEAPLLWRCVTRHEGHPIAHTEAIKLNNVSNKLTGLIWRDSSFVEVMKFVLNFIVAFQRGHGVSFIAVRMVDIVDDMLSSDIMTSNSRQKYYGYIRKAKFFQQLPKNFDVVEQVDGEETGA